MTVRRFVSIELGAGTLLALFLFAGSLWAGDKALAESLFREGRRLMDENQFAQACPKFVESNKQDPSPGTLLNLGKCYEALGKTASAWAEYTEAVTLARTLGRAQQEQEARDRADALEPKLSKLRIDPPPEPIDGLEVKRGGVVMGPGSLGVELPVDPGEYSIEASAPGRSTWTGSVKIGKDGDKQTIAIPALEAAPGQGTPPPVGPTPAGASPAPPASGQADLTADSGGGSKRTLGYVLGGVGIASLGVGTLFGVLAAQQASDAEDDPALCPDKLCSKEGRKEIDSAKTKALISTIGFGVGVAALAAGVTLVLTTPDERTTRRSAPLSARIVSSVGPDGGFVGLSGVFQ
jgi:hypothetical protein